MNNYVINIENINKTYHIGDQKLKVLDNVSFKVKEGEFVAILGPSGSGKSTFMNIIGCLDNCDEGKYLLDNKDVSTLNDEQLSKVRNKKIGFIFQQFNLLNKLNALENVELPMIYQGVKAKNRKIRAIESLKKVGLESKMKNMPNQLSGGQQQRIAIARAIATEPEILLADEPTGALDSKTSKEIMDIIKSLNAEGRTIIMITHDESVASHATRQIKIFDGKIQEQRK